MEDLTRTTLILSGIYILFGLVCMVLVEFTFSILRMRSRMLKETMRIFLEGSAESIFNHPLLRSYGPFFNYLSPGILSAALSDYLMLQGQSGFAGVEDTKGNFQNLRLGIDRIPNSSFKYALTALLTMTNGTVEDFGSKIENWFEDVINQVTGAYKLRAFCCLFATALCLSVATNADTLSMANILWAREAPAQATPSTAPPEKKVSVQPLIGWEAQFPRQLVITKVFGISFTAVVAALFAMLLFDGLNSFTNVRFTGPRPGRERKARAKIDVSSEG